MSSATRPQLLSAAFCLSLCGLGITVGARQLAQVVQPVGIIIDDGDPGFTQDGFITSTSYPLGYGTPPDTAFFTVQPNVTVTNARASWTFTNLAQGTYDVYATWGEHTMRTKNAQFSISETSNTTIVNQKKRPSTMIDKRAWELIATMDVENTGKITVVLTPGSDLTTLADAVMVVKKQSTGTTTVQPTQPTQPAQRASVCGNGKIEGSEQCDDSNVVAHDGCSAACQKELIKNGCNDGKDNDADGKIDMNDLGCADAQDTNELDSISGHISTQKIAGNPPPDFASADINVGDSISFTRTIKEEGLSNSSFTWNVDSSILNCTVVPFDGPIMKCTAKKAGHSPVSLTVTAMFRDGSSRIWTTNMIGVNVKDSTSATQCTPIALKGKPMQNQKNPADVTNDGKVDFWDIRAAYSYLHLEPIGAKIATKTYMNVDGSTDFFNRETFDNNDVQLVVNTVNYCNLPAEKKLTLTSVTIGCEAHANVAKVVFEKNFEGCAHMLSIDGKRLDGQDYICPNIGTISIPLAKLAISPNQSVKICDSLNYATCSQPVNVTGSSCGALPASITLSSAVMSCNAEQKTIVTVHYEAKSTKSTYLNLVDEQLIPRHTTNIFLSNKSKISVPITSFIDVTPGLQLKLCTTNYATCSSETSVTGSPCSTTSGQQRR